MNKLISLEWKRNSMRSYHTGVFISGALMLGLLYLLAAIPKLDPSETDLEMFMSYRSLAGLTNIMLMVIFTILSAVMSAKFVIEEYTGKRAILLFSYPVSRQKVLSAKMCMIFLYTVTAMCLCGMAIFGIFFGTESVFQICSDTLSLATILYCSFSLVCDSLLAGVWGMIALWIGFGKQSVTVTIVAAVIISVVMCQIMAMTLNYFVGAVIFLAVGSIGAVIAWNNLKANIANMEV